VLGPLPVSRRTRLLGSSHYAGTVMPVGRRASSIRWQGLLCTSCPTVATYLYIATGAARSTRMCRAKSAVPHPAQHPAHSRPLAESQEAPRSGCSNAPKSPRARNSLMPGPTHRCGEPVPQRYCRLAVANRVGFPPSWRRPRRANSTSTIRHARQLFLWAKGFAAQVSERGADGESDSR
jgi:hypothetical protein